MSSGLYFFHEKTRLQFDSRGHKVIPFEMYSSVSYLFHNNNSKHT